MATTTAPTLQDIARTLTTMSERLDALTSCVERLAARVEQLADRRTPDLPSHEALAAEAELQAEYEASDPEYRREMAEWLNAPLGPREGEQ